MKNYLLTAMLDLSRNGVMKVEEIKKYTLLLKEMGYNAIGLYMEDTFEIDGEPYFGHLRGRYTKEELKEINAYAKSIGMIAIPYIQTLAHLEGIFKWQTYFSLRDIKDILLIDAPETYDLIEKIFKTMRECFDTDQINIGMDEAWAVGLGNYLTKYGYKENRMEIVYKHLLKVIDIARKYSFKPTMWADMFFSLNVKEEDLKNYIPEDVTLCYWNYYCRDVSYYDRAFQRHLKLTKNFAYAGGAWTWFGFAPLNEYSLQTMKAAMESCRNNEIGNVVITMWGDDGKDCSYYAALNILFYCAEKYLYNSSDEEIKQKFYQKFGVSFEVFEKLSLPNCIKDNIGFNKGNPCRYGLYNDPLFGRFDYHIDIGDGTVYKDYAKQLKVASKSAKEYQYIFDNLSDLCKVLEYKFDLGVRTRNAYIANNLKDLHFIAEQIYPKLIKRLNNFINSYRKVWLKENKPFGFEIQEARLGGLLQRLKDCRMTLLEYLEGKINKIDELEQPVIPLVKNVEKSAKLYEQKYIDTVSPANITHWTF